jgi:two-component system phosphate regulon sensor histidine kinase PhoR
MNSERTKRRKESASDIFEGSPSLSSHTGELFSFLPLSTCLLNSLGVILEANPEFSKISGYPPEEIIGKSIEIIFDKKRIEEFFKEILEKKVIIDREAEIFVKNRKVVPVSVSILLLRDKKEEAVGYFFTFRDLTALRKKESELKNIQAALLNMLEDTELERKRAEEEKNKNVAIITNLTDGLLVFDQDNNLSLVNPQAEKLFNVEAEKLVGKSLAELSQISTFSLLIDQNKQDQEMFRREIQLDKDLILTVTTTSFIREKEKAGTIVILHDISRERVIERMKTEFVSLSAHQLRTPMAAIKWTMTMLLDEDVGKINKDQRDLLEKCYKSNERMILLINDLLNVARIEEGKYLFRPIFAKIDEIINQVVAAFKEEAEKKNIQIEFKESEKETPKVLMDVEKVKLVIENLTDNAIRYTFPGGKITISVSSNKKEIEFKVQDSGVGIPMEQQPRVFTRFFRASNVMRMETEGSGLGLFTSKNIIEAHGGKIWFESKEGKGTAFYFTLPIKSSIIK